jgi:hypothetical protein
MIVRRPFHELKCAYQHRFQLPAIFHLRCGKARLTTPGAGFLLREIRERAFGCLRRTKTARQFLAQCRVKATASRGHVEQVLAFVVRTNCQIAVLDGTVPI